MCVYTEVFTNCDAWLTYETKESERYVIYEHNMGATLVISSTLSSHGSGHCRSIVLQSEIYMAYAF